jgi:hypothetical protein
VSLRQFTVRACFTASCVGALAAPGSAAAQTGVHVDPGSPAGQEYAVPLQATRGDFDGGATKRKTNQGNTNVAPATRSTPAPAPQQSAPPSFGTGITKAKPKRPARTAPKARKAKPAPPATPVAEPRLRDVSADSTVSTTAATGGIVAAVLLVALAVLAVTRRTRRTSSA